MADDLHERRINPHGDVIALNHLQARLDDLLAKFAKLAADHEETWEGLQDLNLVNTRDRVLSHENRIAALEKGVPIHMPVLENRMDVLEAEVRSQLHLLRDIVDRLTALEGE